MWSIWLWALLSARRSGKSSPRWSVTFLCRRSGFVLGHVDFSNLFINLSGTHYDSLAAAKAAGAPTINYGIFINTAIDFAIVAFVIFILVRQINRLIKKDAPAATKDCPRCTSSIPIKATKCPHCTVDIAAS